MAACATEIRCVCSSPNLNIRALVAAYESCRGADDKEALAKQHVMSVEQLYNLISRFRRKTR